jgi:hypothetical protein
MQGKTIPETYNIVLTDFRQFWPSFPSPGFYVALTRCVDDKQLILLCERFTLRKLKSYGPTTQTMNEYGRLWRLFESTMRMLYSNEILPARLDGPPRQRAYINEPVGLENVGKCCWLNASIQMIACMTIVPQLSTDDDLRINELKKSLFHLTETMRKSQDCYIEGSPIKDVLRLSGMQMHLAQDVGAFLSLNEKILEDSSNFRAEGTISCVGCNAIHSCTIYSGRLLLLPAPATDISLNEALRKL